VGFAAGGAALVQFSAVTLQAFCGSWCDFHHAGPCY